MICRKRRLLSSFFILVTFIVLMTWIFRRYRLHFPAEKIYFSIDDDDVAVRLRSNGRQSEYIDKRGMHVVVGKYVGDSLQKDNPTFTATELNENGYHPEPEAGENGQPVFLGGQEAKRAKRLWHINKFNVVVSDKIAVNRTLLDVRKSTCREKVYNDDLPKTSVIIVFHNEAWSTLMRTVHSVIQRTPHRFLAEIVLVDDASNRTFLGKTLESDVSDLPVPVKIIRQIQRSGLVKARLKGAEQASGKVLVFLDAHCEVTAGWIEPLLQRITEKRSAVVCPVIDIINDDSFAYIKSFSLHWGAFNWELHFRWFTMGKSAMDSFVASGGVEPFDTPTMAGGLFAIDRDYFYEMGSYDEQMDIWGGENLEMSFRIWMCGGSVEIAPCSHVGHVFRKASPYTFPREGGVNHVLHTNLARVASVWLDDHAAFYFKLNAKAKQEADSQDVTQRLHLRRHLQCKSFQWYLDHVWPENFFPSQKRSYGKLRHAESGKCLQRPPVPMAPSSQTPKGQASLTTCANDFHVYQQLVVDNESGAIMSDESMCLDVPNHQDMKEATVRFMACNQMDRQKWHLQKDVGHVVHNLTNHCLTFVEQGSSDQIMLKPCVNHDATQQFQLRPEDWQ